MTDSRADVRSDPAGRFPVMLETSGWPDYALLDSGAGEKLERYGRYRIVRPEPQALWQRRLEPAFWESADAVFTGAKDEDADGRWRYRKPLPETWEMECAGVRFLGRFTAFRHVGVFPEQESHWAWMTELMGAAGRPLKILNLFGYTGLASLLAARAGAQVTHVDASKKAIAWARDNQALSGLDDKPIRWILDDALKFAAREVRRGRRYDAVLLDPPKFGRGPKGETWDLFANLPEMLTLCRDLVRPGGFLILTAYAIRASFLSVHRLSAEVFGPGVQSGELALRDESGGLLGTSLFSRWTAQ